MSSSDQVAALDWRPILLAGLAWAGVWVGTSGISVLVFCCTGIGILCCLLAGRNSSWLTAAVGLVILVLPLVAGARVWAQELSPVGRWAAEDAVVELTAKVGAGRVGVSEHGQWWQASVWVSEVSGRGEHWATGVPVRVVASAGLLDSWAAIPPGATVRATVKLEKQVDISSDVAVARAREPPMLIETPGVVDHLIERLHLGLRETVEQLAPDPRGLVPALVVGDTGTMSLALRDQFVTTGLTHLTAVSGANLTILLGVASFGIGRLGVRGWWLRGCLVCVVMFFILLCRGEPSVLRAAAMGVVALSALGIGRARQGIRYLAWAVILLLLVDPWLGRSVGFALSVAATAGIVLWAQPWTVKLACWMPKWLAAAICVPVAAQLATQPLVTAISGQVSLVGIFANLLAGPLVAPATVLGFVAIPLALVSVPLAAIPGTVAGWFAQGLCWIAEYGSSFPGSALSWKVDVLSVTLIGLISLGIVLVLPRVWASSLLTFGVLAALVLAILQPISPGPTAPWLMTSCSVGQGDATVFNAGPSAALVVDTGPDPRSLDRCLSQLGITQTAVVLTHFHADHIGGVAALRQGRELTQVWVSEVREPIFGWDAVATTVAGVPISNVAPGVLFTFGTVQVEVLAAKQLETGFGQNEGESAQENDSSLVMRVHNAGLTVLLGGDIEVSGQRAAALNADLSVDVALVPHHGSARQWPGYLQEAQPQVAIISVGIDNSYGHPAPAVLIALRGIKVFRTDLDGSIMINKENDVLRIATFSP